MNRGTQTAGIEQGGSSLGRLFKILLVLAPLVGLAWLANFVSGFDEKWPDGMERGPAVEAEGVLHAFDPETQTAQLRTYDDEADQCVQLKGAAQGQREALSKGTPNPPAYDMRVIAEPRFGRSNCGGGVLPFRTFLTVTSIKTGIAITCGPDDFIARRRHCP